MFFNKKAMCREAVRAGLRVPESLFSPARDQDLAAWSRFPAIVKPAASRFQFEGEKLKSIDKFRGVFGGKALTAQERSELLACVQRVQDQGLEYCVQEYIPGGSDAQFTVYFVAARDGTIPAFSSHYKVRRRPAAFGTTAVSQSKSAPALRDYAEQFCRTTGYSGPGLARLRAALRLIVRTLQGRMNRSVPPDHEPSLTR